MDPESPMPFMPREPIDIMKEGAYSHVPLIIGITDDEGAFKASALMHDMKALKELESEFEKLGPLIFGLHDGQCEAPKIHANQVCRNQIYFVVQIPKYNFNENSLLREFKRLLSQNS